MSKVGAFLISLAAALCASCGSSSPSTPDPQVPAVTLTCPAAAASQSLDGAPVAVSFADPTVQGGTSPFRTICSPASGTSFALGTSTVSCSTTDAKLQKASCTFPVTVTKVPQLSVTNIDAFGDSITEGAVSVCGALTMPSGIRPVWDSLRFDAIIDSSRSYPTKLQALVRARYTAQTINVANDGRGGEYTIEGVSRVTSVLSTRRPQVLLVQEGANDINQGVARSEIATNLRDIARRGRESGAQAVFVGTLLPQRAGACRGYAPDRVASTNEAIRTMVASEGFSLVDLEAAFGGVPGDLIGADGLHPSDAGYDKIAATFFDAIRQRFEK